MSEDDKARYKREIKSLKEASQTEQQNLRNAIHKLSKTGLWQIDAEWTPPNISATPATPSSNSVAVAKSDEVLAQLADLRTTILGVHGSATELGKRLDISVPPISLSAIKGASGSELGSGVDSGLPPKKRRRLSEVDDGNDDVRMKDAGSSVEGGGVSIRGVRDLVQQLEDRVRGLEEQVKLKSKEVEEAVKKDAEVKVEELRKQLESQLKVAGEQEAKERKEKIEEVSKEVDQTGSDIEEMAQEIAELMERSAEFASLVEENAKLNAEVIHLKQELISVSLILRYSFWLYTSLTHILFL